MAKKQLDSLLLKKGYTLKNKINKSDGIQAYLALRENGEKVVIKLARVQSAWVKVLRKELENLTQLKGLNIPVVLDTFIQGEVEVIVLKYIPGMTLLELKQKKRIQWSEIRNIFLLLLKTVNDLHLKNYIHCDLKPQNILYDRGEVYLIDFGSAKQQGENVTFIQFTPEYSQELECLIKNCSKNRDIYGLFMVFKYLLIGKSKDTVCDLPENLRNFIEKGLKDNPKDSYRDTEEILEFWDILNI